MALNLARCFRLSVPFACLGLLISVSLLPPGEAPATPWPLVFRNHVWIAFLFTIIRQRAKKKSRAIHSALYIFIPYIFFPGVAD